MTKFRYAYMCGTAYESEIEQTDVTLYPTLESLLESTKCTDECGVVKVQIKLMSYVLEPNFDIEADKAHDVDLAIDQRKEEI